MREELGKEGKETQGGKDEGKGKKKVERRVGGSGKGDKTILVDSDVRLEI